MNSPARRFWKAVAEALLPAPPRTTKRPLSRRPRLGLEVLEDRAVPAVLMVTSAADDLSAGTLRSEVAIANLASTLGGTPVTIGFAPALGGKTITLTHGELDLYGSSKAPITIDGGNSITISGNHNSRVFKVEPNGSADIIGVTITGGTGTPGTTALDLLFGQGGGIANLGALTLENSTLSGNKAVDGGGIVNAGGTLKVLDSTLSGNSASADGGGVFNTAFAGRPSSLEAIDSAITANNAEVGGGIENQDHATVTGSTFSANSTVVGGSGGAIFNGSKSFFTVTNSTLAANIASYAGAIFNEGTMTLSDTTVAANLAGLLGGGIENIGGLVLESTIVADNLAKVAADIYGSASGSFNLIGTNNSSLTGIANGDAGHNLVGTAAKPLDPHLAPLNYYGGPTKTMPLLTGSAAIGAGGPLTTLSASISATATTIPLADVQVVGVSGGGYIIQIGTEQMLVTSGNIGTNTVTVQRGYDGTKATTHSAGAGVFTPDDQSGRPWVINGRTNIGAMGPAISLTPNTNSLPSVETGSFFATLLTASGGDGVYTFASYGLPSWMHLSKNGVLSGAAPANAGTYGFTIEVNDSNKLTTYWFYTLVVTP
jgi:hypothetical protein